MPISGVHSSTQTLPPSTAGSVAYSAPSSSSCFSGVSGSSDSGSSSVSFTA